MPGLPASRSRISPSAVAGRNKSRYNQEDFYCVAKKGYLNSWLNCIIKRFCPLSFRCLGLPPVRTSQMHDRVTTTSVSQTHETDRERTLAYAGKTLITLPPSLL